MYEDALDSARDLVADANGGRLRPILFRGSEVGKALEHLDAARSVLITGAQGAGKTAVIHGIAAALAKRGKGGLRQVSCNEILAGTRYLGEWQSKVVDLASQAAATDTTLYFSDIWNLQTVGKTSQDPSGILDSLGPLIESGVLRLLGEVLPERLREMQRDPRLINLFQHVSVQPLSAAEIDEVIEKEGERGSVQLDAETRRTLVSLSSRFLPSRGQPGPALELLARTRDYQAEKTSVGETTRLTVDFVEKVFSIYSGLPRFIVSRTETVSAREIRSWFSDRIVGQKEAVESIIEMIALFKAGLQDPARPIGTFLFVGPTGVGKTELARALAEFLFGSSHRLLRFDLSEFKDYHSFEMLLGDPDKPAAPARLLDPVRSHPFQVVLFDELEKAHSNVWDMLLPLLDDGQLSRPNGDTVGFRNTIVIATSNVGARDADKALGFGSTANRDEATKKALDQAFRPEFLNRFQHVVVFHPLTLEQVKLIAKLELARILSREGISDRNIIVDVDEAALEQVIARGFDLRYGARALKRELQRQVVLPVAMALMERPIEAGTLLRVVEKGGELKVRVIDTEESRERRREREPVTVDDGEKKARLTRDEILERVSLSGRRIDALANAVDHGGLETRHANLSEERRRPDFWSEPVAAAIALRDLDRIGLILHRIDRLRTRADELRGGIEQADMRRAVVDLGARLGQLERDTEEAELELVTMGTEGVWDALVEIRPLGDSGKKMRDMLLGVYRGWAEHRSMTVTLLREPLEDGEAAMIAVSGRSAHGYLAREHGLHRLREGESTSVVSVRVAPWTDATAQPELIEHRALKKTGQLGGNIRSRLTTASGLVLQNEKRLVDNRDLAADFDASWRSARPDNDTITRRYDLAPFLLRDVLTGESIGRADALRGPGFHQLLCRRLLLG